MAALTFPSPDDGPSILRLFRPEETPEADRGILNPPVAGRRRKRKPAPNQKPFWQTLIDPDVAAIAAAVEREFRDPIVPEARREQLRKNLTMRQFWSDWMLPERGSRVEAGLLSRSSLKKDRQALTRWERFSRPDDWPADKPWAGIPIGSITALYLEWVLTRMRAVLEPATVRSTWNHIRTILNYAERVRALEKAPKRERQKVQKTVARTYTAEQIAVAYNALEDYIDLQVAFVLGCNAGPRTVDLFLLRWDGVTFDGDRSTVAYRAFKTDKDQRVPLAPVTVQQLLRLPSRGRSEYLFPGRSNPKAKEPEDSKPALRRRELIRILLTHAGVDVVKPFQVARATCNTRLNSTPGYNGAGAFLLGHDLTCNSLSYFDPSDMVFAAINAVPQPACFLNL